MAKKRVSKKIESEITKYIKALKADNVPIRKVVLFGSYAKGTQNKWSDIDLCIISPKFKNPWRALQYLINKRLNDRSPIIEPIGLSPKDFSDDYDSLVYEIKSTGIEIPLTQKIFSKKKNFS